MVSIDMGVPDVDMSVLKTNDEGPARHFRIELDGYTIQAAGLMTVGFKLTGTSADTTGNQSIYENEVSPTNGGANGAGIRVRKYGITKPTATSTGSTFTNGETLTGDYTANYTGNFAYYFDAAIVPTNEASLTAGHVKSTVEVIVYYK